MSHVTVKYEMFLPGGHHRQPRNVDVTLDLNNGAAGADVPNPGSIAPPYFAELPYTSGGGSGLSKLLFWSVTDGTQGTVLPPVPLVQTVGALPLQIVAWYFPISGPASPGDTPELIGDAVSAREGAFIDDTFVDVTSDPSLTNDANVIGIVPTSVSETLVAHAAVTSTTEPFREWALNDGFMPAGVQQLSVPASTEGKSPLPFIRMVRAFSSPRFPRNTRTTLGGGLKRARRSCASGTAGWAVV